MAGLTAFYVSASVIRPGMNPHNLGSRTISNLKKQRPYLLIGLLWLVSFDGGLLNCNRAEKLLRGDPCLVLDSVWVQVVMRYERDFYRESFSRLRVSTSKAHHWESISQLLLLNITTNVAVQ